MNEKKIVINEKEYTIKVIKYVDAIALQDMGKVDMARALLKSSAGLTDEEINELTLKEGLELQTQINELCGLDTDFQKPVV